MTITQNDDVLDGMPHIAGTRIGVHHVVRAFKDRDLKTEEIASRVYPDLSEKEARNALVYAIEESEKYRHHLEQHQQRKEEIKSEIASRPDEFDIPSPTS